MGQNFVNTEPSAIAGSSGATVSEKTPVRNAMSVDVEDYFQVSAFESHIDRAQWDSLDCRVERNTDRILELFDAKGVRATFFTLAWVARRYPELIRRFVAGGHEVASHGLAHVRATEQTPEQFHEDARVSKLTLEDISGAPVVGYRAASFSINRTNLWAHDILETIGYTYSSSIYPVRHDLYGVPDAPRFAFRRRRGGIVEVPVTTVKLAGQNLPCGGGGYFRLLPYAYFKWAIGRVNRTDRRASVFYFHPWEIDAEQPRQKGLGVKTAFRHYNNLARTLPRLDKLCSQFRWGRMDEVFLGDEKVLTQQVVALEPSDDPRAHGHEAVRPGH